jgi:hypothetical protein
MKPIPVIILGAGASAGYLKERYLRGRVAPPTTDRLLEPSYILDNKLTKCPDVQNLFSRISNLQNSTTTFEDCLSLIKRENRNISNDQIRELSFYLKTTFSFFSSQYYHINHFKDLIQKIEKYYEGKACVINFNYDTLFEQSIEREFKDMNDYISQGIFVIKVHGSCDWIYVVSKSSLERYGNNKVKFFKQNPNYTKDAEPYTLKFFNESTTSNQNKETLPALALPLLEKQDFICSSKHISKMKELIKQTDRILIIGWSARDGKFLDEIRSEIPKLTSFTIVSGNRAEAIKVEERIKLSIGNNFNFNPTKYSFETFLQSEDKFFS